MNEETSGSGSEKSAATRFSDVGRPIGDFGLRKRRVASREQLPLARTPEKHGLSTARATVGILEEQSRGQPVRMKRGWRGRGSLFISRRRSSEEERKPSVPKKSIIRLSVLQRKGFVTADVHKGYDAAYIVFAMRDLILYLIYLSVLLLIGFGSNYSAYNYYSDLIDDLLTDSNFLTPVGPNSSIVSNFHGIRTPQQMWSFVQHNFMEFIFDDEDPLKRGSQVLLESILIGAPAIRQLRVLNNTCTTAPLFADLYKTCYDYYHYEYKDRNNLESIHNSNVTKSANWIYFSEKILTGDTYPYEGVMGSYGGGGFKMNISNDRTVSELSLSELESANWIRIGSRFITIDFSLYTANTNLFCLAKLNFEHIPAGGIIPNHFFYTLKLFRYSTAFDTFILACEIIFICFTVFFTFEEVQQMYILKEDYLANWWNILDILIILLSYATIGVGIYRFVVVTIYVDDQVDLIRTNINSNFDGVLYVENKFKDLLAMLVFAAWIKLLKFSSLNRSILAILAAFHHVAEELAALTTMALTIGTGFAVCGHLLYGYAIYEFAEVRRSILTMFSIYVGQMNFYEKCSREYPIITPIFFSTYIIIIIIIYFNMFVALLVHGFQKVKVFLNEEPDRLYLDDWVYAIVLHILQLLRQNYLVEKIMTRNLIQRMNRDYNELVQILKRHGFHFTEIELMLNAFDLRPGSELELDSMYDLYNEICVRNQLFIEVEDHHEIQRVMDKIDSMLEHSDQALLDITAKIEILGDMVAKIDARPNIRGMKGKK